MNVDNLRDCIEHSPRLKFSHKINTNSCIDGVVDTHVIESEYLVDYENKTATAMTKTTLAGGAQDFAKIVYKDNRVLKSTFNNLLDGNEGKNLAEEELSSSEYENLFSEKGGLRPINFDLIKPVEVEDRIANTMALAMEAPNKNELAGWNAVYSAAVSLCSEDTLKLSILSSQTSKENPQNMMVSVNEIVIHMC